MIGFDTIIKLTMGLIVIFVVFGIVHTLFPNALKSFSETTHIEFPTFSFGKEKQESDFEITENMQQNAKLIKQKIEEMSADDYDSKKGLTTFQMGTIEVTDPVKEKIKEPEFKKFEGNLLAIIKGEDGKSDIAYIAVTDQINPKYDTIEYTPCFVTVIETGWWLFKKLGFSEKKIVDKILFVDANHFKISGDEKKYGLKGLTKIDNDVCFVGE